ncbi:hypothetical protein SAY86_015124 [Trapa natans]|uniref:Uncharacterized protein n=1 Tax=Trapa natans TaxID=22666 RepID=A0AAN7QGZ1_TRANT|nr:hypothetical protein SAY86_015124 [Trapa natans]
MLQTAADTNLADCVHIGSTQQFINEVEQVSNASQKCQHVSRREEAVKEKSILSQQKNVFKSLMSSSNLFVSSCCSAAGKLEKMAGFIWANSRTSPVVKQAL